MAMEEINHATFVSVKGYLFRTFFSMPAMMTDNIKIFDFINVTFI